MSTCGSKKVYYTRSQAMKAMKAEGQRMGVRLYFYECTDCHYYHLSHHDHKRKVYEIKSAGIRFLA
jgi:hypothetical protein